MHDVHWSEGMLLLPQHLQLFRTFLLERTALAAMQRVGVGAYGVRALEWNLSHETLAIVAADLTLPCGTLVRVPEECSIPAAPIAAKLAASKGALDVWAGVPLPRVGVSAIASDENRNGRYRVQQVMVRDEVDASSRTERQVLVRRVNARLFVGEDDRAGYSCVRVARVGRRSDLEPEPELERGFVPPLLDVTADGGLRRRLQALCGTLRRKSESLGHDVSSQPFALALQSGANPDQIFKLSALNSQLGAIEQLCLTKGVHPFDTYLALCRLAGSLALFSTSRVCPEFPAYDHDRLAACFDPVIAQIEQSLGKDVFVHYERREFSAAPGGAPICPLLAEWLQHGSELYLAAVGTSATPEVLDGMMGQQVKLFGAGDEAKHLMVPGIRLQRQLRVPPALPSAPNLHYFRFDREATPTPRWAAMQTAEAVELKLEGDTPGDLRFEVFVVPRRAGQ